jgi:hypothetical protein
MQNRKNRNWKKKQNKNRADKTIISQIILRLSASDLLDNITKQREYVTAQREENGQERSENYEYWYGFPCKSAEKDCEEYSTAETAEESNCICCGCFGFTGSRSWEKETCGSCGRCPSKYGCCHSFFFTTG